MFLIKLIIKLLEEISYIICIKLGKKYFGYITIIIIYVDLLI